jgi:ribosomal-protein-alanine N-acetyltransferase
LNETRQSNAGRQAGQPLEGILDVGIPGKLTLLRPVEPEDAPLLRFLMNDPAITDSIVGFNPPVSLRQQHQWIDGPRGGPTGPWHLTIVERSTGEAVGLTKIHSVDWREGTARHGIKLHPSTQGRGLAYDACMARNAWAFFVAGVRRLETTILDFNIPSQRLTERLGYTLEGRRREAVQRNGRWCDVLVYGLLRSDAERMPQVQEYRLLVAPVAPTSLVD